VGVSIPPIFEQASKGEQMKRITMEEVQMINGAIDRAITDSKRALPDGDDQELVDWIMTNQKPVFGQEIEEALAHEYLKVLIREQARILGIPLYEDFTPDGKTVKN
jgi:hypothetical protein